MNYYEKNLNIVSCNSATNAINGSGPPKLQTEHSNVGVNWVYNSNGRPLDYSEIWVPTVKHRRRYMFKFRRLNCGKG